MQIMIKTRGLRELIAKNKKLISDLEKGKFNKALAEKIKNRAKYRAPRDTGELIRSIHYKLTGSNITIICDARNERGEPYPAILEFGLSRFISIGSPESPRILSSGSSNKSRSSGKTAYLPFIQWAIWRTLKERDRIFKQTMLKQYK